jgi:hypothetical protein
MPTYQKIVYNGRLAEYQRFGNQFKKSNVEYEKDKYNSYQNFLYKRALFGLSVYSEEEKAVMHTDKKKRIAKVHERAQQILNVWKQELTHEYTASLLGSMFYHSSFVKDYCEKFAGVTDPEYISPMEFKDLGITKDKIVQKLIEERILPFNFYQLSKP